MDQFCPNGGCNSWWAPCEDCEYRRIQQQYYEQRQQQWSQRWSQRFEEWYSNQTFTNSQPSREEETVQTDSHNSYIASCFEIIEKTQKDICQTVKQIQARVQNIVDSADDASSDIASSHSPKSRDLELNSSAQTVDKQPYSSSVVETTTYNRDTLAEQELSVIENNHTVQTEKHIDFQNHIVNSLDDLYQTEQSEQSDTSEDDPKGLGLV